MASSSKMGPSAALTSSSRDDAPNPWGYLAARRGGGLQFTGPVQCSRLRSYALTTAAGTSRECVPFLFTRAAGSLLECAAGDGLCHGVWDKTGWDGKREVKILGLINFTQTIAVSCEEQKNLASVTKL